MIGPVSAGRMRSWLGRRGGVTAALAVALAAGLIFTGGTDAFYSGALTSGVSTFAAGTGTWDYSAQVLADGPVAYWRLGDAAGAATAADQTGTNPGTYLNGPVLARPGAPGAAAGGDTAAGFDGVDDSVKIPTSTSLDTKTKITVEAWFKYGSTAGRGPIVEYNNTTAFGVQLWRNSGPNDLYANFVDTGGVSHKVQSEGVLTPNVWHQAVAVYDGTNGFLYLDGALVASATLGSFTLQTSYDLYVSARPSPSPSVYGQQDVDDVSVYNGVLSAARVAAHYAYGA